MENGEYDDASSESTRGVETIHLGGTRTNTYLGKKPYSSETSGCGSAPTSALQDCMSPATGDDDDDDDDASRFSVASCVVIFWRSRATIATNSPSSMVPLPFSSACSTIECACVSESSPPRGERTPSA